MERAKITARNVRQRKWPAVAGGEKSIFGLNILILTANGVWVVPLVLYLELQALYKLQVPGFEENLTFYIPVSLSQRLLYLNGLGASCAAPELARNPLYLGLFVSRSEPNEAPEDKLDARLHGELLPGRAVGLQQDLLPKNTSSYFIRSNLFRSCGCRMAQTD